jgi:hypothetical protein
VPRAKRAKSAKDQGPKRLNVPEGPKGSRAKTDQWSKCQGPKDPRARRQKDQGPKYAKEQSPAIKGSKSQSSKGRKGPRVKRVMGQKDQGPKGPRARAKMAKGAKMAMDQKY